MINKDTILSAFDDKGTLLKWLKKVEAALKDAVLTDISLVQISATEVKFKFTFENGDFVESPVITLPRGEQGPQGPQGEQGPQGPQGETYTLSNFDKNDIAQIVYNDYMEQAEDYAYGE